VNALGQVTWKGYGAGCGRAGEDYAFNKIEGSGWMELAEVPNPEMEKEDQEDHEGVYYFIRGEETLELGSCEWIYPERGSDEDEEDDEDDERESGDPHFYETKRDSVLYCRTEYDGVKGGSLVHEITYNMEW
jgi:hypothetical protein